MSCMCTRVKKGASAFTLIELLIVVAIIAILAAIAVPNFLEAQTRAKVTRVKSDFRTLATAIESYVVDWEIPPICAYGGPLSQVSGNGPISSYADIINCFTGLTSPLAYVATVSYQDPLNTISGQYGDVSGYYYMNWSGMYRNLSTGILPSVHYTGGHPGGDITLSMFSSNPPRVYLNQSFEGYVASWSLTSAGPDRMFRDIKLDGNLTSLLWDSAWGLGDYLGKPYYSSGAPNGIAGGYCCTYDPTNGTKSGGNIWRFSSMALE